MNPYDLSVFPNVSVTGAALNSLSAEQRAVLFAQ